jgi:hypothetical protein
MGLKPIAKKKSSPYFKKQYFLVAYLFLQLLVYRLKNFCPMLKLFIHYKKL